MLIGQPVATDAASQAGFTLTELIIVATLLMIVVAVAGQAMTRAFFAQERAGAERTSITQINRAWEYLGNDIRAASSPIRRNITDPYELRQQLRVVDASRDFVIAAPRHLRFRADVTDAPNAECVDYEVTGERWLTRTVAVAAACNSTAPIATPLSRTNLVSLRAATVGAAPGNIFEYRVVNAPTYEADRTDSTQCRIVDKPAGSTLGTTGGSAYPEINRAVGISLSLDSFVDNERVAVRSQLQTSLQIKSRLDNPVYMESMGCLPLS